MTLIDHEATRDEKVPTGVVQDLQRECVATFERYFRARLQAGISFCHIRICQDGVKI